MSHKLLVLPAVEDIITHTIEQQSGHASDELERHVYAGRTYNRHSDKQQRKDRQEISNSK